MKDPRQLELPFPVTLDDIQALVKHPPSLRPVNESNPELYRKWCEHGGRIPIFSTPTPWTELDVWNWVLDKRKEK